MNGSLLHFEKTDKVVVHYAKLNSVDLGVEFFTMIMRPIAFATPSHEYVRVGYQEMMADPRGALGCLKRAVLKRYVGMLNASVNSSDEERLMQEAGLGWMWEINDVELVECRLLVPKMPVYDVPHALLVSHVADAHVLPHPEGYAPPLAFQELQQ